MNDVFELNLRHLNALVVIARLGTMSAAAQHVSLSQPALAQAIGKIERLLGLQLFDRLPAGAVPTEAGDIMVIRVGRAMHYLAQGGRLVRRSARLAPLGQIERQVTMAQLRALDAVEATSSYALAAQRTGLSQPAVHRAVRDLQEILGMPLLVRIGRAVRPTETAIRFVRFVRLMLSELRAGINEIAALDAHYAGRISVGTLPMTRVLFLPELLARFAAAHPTASVQVLEAPYHELLESLRQGDIDLLLGASERNPLPASDVAQEVLFDDHPLIVAHAEHPLRGKPVPTIADLLDFPWVIPGRNVPMRGNWERMFSSQGVQPPEPRIECGSVLITRGLLLKGGWLTVMSPDQFLLEKQGGVLGEIALPLPGLRRRITLTQRRDWRPTQLQADFFELARCLGRERQQDPEKLYPEAGPARLQCTP